jgi:hypothetical protein
MQASVQTNMQATLNAQKVEQLMGQLVDPDNLQAFKKQVQTLAEQEEGDSTRLMNECRQCFKDRNAIKWEDLLRASFLVNRGLLIRHGRLPAMGNLEPVRQLDDAVVAQELDASDAAQELDASDAAQELDASDAAPNVHPAGAVPDLDIEQQLLEMEAVMHGMGITGAGNEVQPSGELSPEQV